MQYTQAQLREQAALQGAWSAAQAREREQAQAQQAAEAYQREKEAERIAALNQLPAVQAFDAAMAQRQAEEQAAAQAQQAEQDAAFQARIAELEAQRAERAKTEELARKLGKRIARPTF